MAQPIRTAGGQPYGAAKAQADAQRAVPLADANSYQAPVVPLGAPSMRPGEHVMSGADVGPGPNAAQAGVPVNDDGSPDAVLSVLRGIFQTTQNTDLFDVIRAIEMQQSPNNYGLADMRNAHGNWGRLDTPYGQGGGIAADAATSAYGLRIVGERLGTAASLPVAGNKEPPSEPQLQFDPGARLDQSQVSDQRVPTGLGMAAAAAAAAAGVGGVNPGTGEVLNSDGQTAAEADAAYQASFNKLRMKGPR